MFLFFFFSVSFLLLFLGRQEPVADGGETHFAAPVNTLSFSRNIPGFVLHLMVTYRSYVLSSGSGLLEPGDGQSGFPPIA